MKTKDKNLYKDSSDRYFRTNQFNIAAFLFAKGFELAGIDKTTNPRRAEFIFANSLELELAVHEFNFAKDSSPEILVNARTLFSSIKQLKNILYQDLRS